MAKNQLPGRSIIAHILPFAESSGPHWHENFIRVRITKSGVMENNQLVAHAETSVHGTADEVWEALTNPALIKQYMMGADVRSSWKTGSKIIWQGEWKGKKYKDHGEVLDATPGKYLRYTHITGNELKKDPDNQHTVTVELDEAGDETRVVLTQDNNADQKALQDSEKNWQLFLDGLKKVVESNHS